jgi:hypothetical protein
MEYCMAPFLTECWRSSHLRRDISRVGARLVGYLLSVDPVQPESLDTINCIFDCIFFPRNRIRAPNYSGNSPALAGSPARRRRHIRSSKKFILDQSLTNLVLLGSARDTSY